jgi:hypothetical protein
VGEGKRSVVDGEDNSAEVEELESLRRKKEAFLVFSFFFFSPSSII